MRSLKTLDEAQTLFARAAADPLMVTTQYIGAPPR
jgi:hypothetical protein